MRIVNVGILGCGVISHTYIRDIQRLYKGLNISACGDCKQELAVSHAAAYGIPRGCTTKELLAMEEIELVINLTPPQLHEELNRQILNAGKHVFCEKPFALSVQEGKALLDLARSKGLVLCSAPDTFMGSAMQTCRKLLEEGWIGRPLYATANMMTNGVETWHPAPEHFYRKGAGPLYDMGPYYFGALAALLGPIKSISAFAGKGFSERTVYVGSDRGKTVPVEIPTHYSGTALMENGVIASLNFSFDIWKSDLPMFELYGTEGTLVLPDPNMSGGKPLIYRMEKTLDSLYCEEEQVKAEKDCFTEVPELYPHIGQYTRGIGVMDTAAAIAEQREPRASGAFALHVLEAITGMMEAAETGTRYQMMTDCRKPPMLPLGRRPWEWT